MEEKGQNFLIPTSYKEEDSLDLEYTALKVATVLETLDRAGCNLSLVFLDACRSSTLPARSLGGTSRSLGRGLAKIEAPTGMLISFACAPGSTASDGAGRNGVYTTSLLEHLPREEDVQKVLGYVVSGVQKATNGAQVPWMSGALARDPGRNNGNIHLIEPQLQSASAPATAPSAPAPRTSSVSALDEAAAAGADVAGLTEWLARVGLAKHEASVIPKLVTTGVLTVDDVLKQEESDIAELGLPKFEQQQLVKALKAIAGERQTQAEAERKAKEAAERASKAEAERIERERREKSEAERREKEEAERKAKASAEAAEAALRAKAETAKTAAAGNASVVNAAESATTLIAQAESRLDFAALVAVMRGNPSNAAVQEHGCVALANLARNDDANKVKAGSAGAIEAVVAALKAHPSNAFVQVFGCAALNNLACNDANRVKAWSAGAIEAVVAALKAHPSDAAVELHGTAALVRLRRPVGGCCTLQ